MDNAFAFLKQILDGELSFGQIVDAFETMTKMPISSDDDILLYETGTFPFTGKPLFYFSLVRQCSIPDDDEYIQLHVDIMFEPDQYNAHFSESIWSDDIEEGFFDYIRNSPAFIYSQNAAIAKVDVFMDET